MKRALAYIIVAVILGLTLTLFPLFTIAKIETENHAAELMMFSRQLETLEGSYASTPTSIHYEFEILAFSLVIATAVYLLHKRKASSTITDRQD